MIRTAYLVDVDNGAQPLVLVLVGVHRLGDVPGDRAVIEIIVDVVIDAAGHASEELGHVVMPVTTPGPGGVIEHGEALDKVGHGPHVLRK
eukprot:CAMPEP_0113676386 /NCGR_PEP_ID=MMETSP0038_2-20120614/8614_1 /TAXON_ID=2898 /ORGANISM="Cryptomonas paramecium" /LENGTH=89 /DNA_ID=CAMNT_0000593409 /DNA_START=102 /DNA_END=371 /DNA_ORIENTATION=- /assembly_acc=CAM_ASM_000170